MSALYKVTDLNGAAFHGGSGRWVKNRWRSVEGDLIPCERGLHLCRREDLLTWLGPVIWRAEYDGELIERDDKVVVRRARVIERYDTWTERTARLFAADCAERVLPIYEKDRPNDDRPRKAIEVARAYARGEVGDQEWAAAWAAARAAAGAAARAAARDAAWAAARDAAWAAVGADFKAWATDRLFDYLEGRAA